MTQKITVYQLGLVFSLCVFFASCKTAPQMPGGVLEENGFVPLEPGAFACVFVNAAKARPILELLNIREMDSRQLQQVIDRTRFAAAAFYPPASGRRFQIAAWGKYPAARAGMALGANRDWKKIRSGTAAPYWYSAANSLSLSLDSWQSFVVASADPMPPFAASPGIEVPAGFAEFSRGAALSVWLESPGWLLNPRLAEMGIPLELPAQWLFAAIAPAAGNAATGDEQHYEAVLQIQFASAVQARAIATLFALARGFVPAAGGGWTAALAAVLFANPPVQDGAKLNIQSAPLTVREIALLFDLFSI